VPYSDLAIYLECILFGLPPGHGAVPATNRGTPAVCRKPVSARPFRSSTRDFPLPTSMRRKPSSVMTRPRSVSSINSIDLSFFTTSGEITSREEPLQTCLKTRNSVLVIGTGNVSILGHAKQCCFARIPAGFTRRGGDCGGWSEARCVPRSRGKGPLPIKSRLHAFCKVIF